MVTKKAFEHNRLDQICQEIIDCPHSTPIWTQSGCLVLRSHNIRNGKLDLSDPSYTDEEHYQERTRRAVPQEDDLVITREAPMGEVCKIPVGLKCCLGQRMVLLRPNPTFIDPAFLLYALQAPFVQNQIMASEGTGSTVSNLRIPHLSALLIPSPPMPVQHSIANILGTLDDKIELNRRMNATLEAMARALFRSWFVDFDPVRAKAEGREPAGMDATTAALFPDEFEESELGEIPKGWLVRTLGEICEVVDCLHAKKPDCVQDGKLFMQLNNIRDDGLLDITERFLISDEDYSLWTSRIEVKEGDCVITNVGRVGAVSQIPPRVKAAMGRNMTSLRLKPGYPYPTFLIQLLLSSAIESEIERNIDSGTILDALNVRNIPKLRFVGPNQKIIEKFERVVRPIRATMEGNLTESLTLSDLRDLLLPQLISGYLPIITTGIEEMHA